MKILTVTALSLFLISSCVNQSQEASSTEVITEVLHKTELAQMSPEEVLGKLKAGNQNFVNKTTQQRDIKAQLVESAEAGQAPMAIVLSCIDSRVPVEMIFDMGLGDIFVSRVAGNIINTDILGSMEYACEHSGSKIVVVLGHESCGAVHAACEGVEAGNMTEMLAKISPAIEQVKKQMSDPHSEQFQNTVVVNNVNNMVARVRQESEILAHAEAAGEIKIVGGMFNLHSGVVEFWEVD